LSPANYEKAHRPALILLFAKKFFQLGSAARIISKFDIAALRPPLHRPEWGGLGRIFWLLASALLPAFTIAFSNDWPWEVVSSYSSATAPGFHGISRADPLFQARKELAPELPACASALKIFYQA